MVSLPASGLTRAQLCTYDPPEGTASRPGRVRRCIELQFNPRQLSLTKSASFARSQAALAESAATPQFMSADPSSLSFEVVLDASRNPFAASGVEDQVKELLDCCRPTERSIAGKLPSPPWVKFEWGQSGTASFYSYLTHIDAVYTLFGPDGVPLRATCGLTLQEIGGDTPRQNPTSGAFGLRTERLVLRGDSLAQIAWEEYGDTRLWRQIAVANAIDAPEHIVPGQVLVLPRIEEIETLEGP